jgi:sec-independent protein translocase protein TatB
MDILGIGPGEFILILIVLLVVVGPERLPGLARQAGGLLVRARNWLQTSPDAALVMRARQEIDAELASLKASLMEVQVVRDEVLEAAKQFEDSVGTITSTNIDINPQIKPPPEPTIAANGQALPDPALEAPAVVDTAAAIEQPTAIDLPEASDAPVDAPAAPQLANGLANGVAYADITPQPTIAAPPALAELESINVRLQAIMADMWALQQQLKQRGALDETWQPPSVDIQMPAPETAPLAGPAEPIEDAAVLAARKRLEQLAPMQVSYHAPPVVEPTSVESSPELDPAPEPADPAVAPQLPVEPVAKARKRRAKTTQAAGALELPAMPSDDPPTPGDDSHAPAEPLSAESQPIAGPAANRRKRRAPADSATPAEQSEPVTTENAS